MDSNVSKNGGEGGKEGLDWKIPKKRKNEFNTLNTPEMKLPSKKSSSVELKSPPEELSENLPRKVAKKCYALSPSQLAARRDTYRRHVSWDRFPISEEEWRHIDMMCETRLREMRKEGKINDEAWKEIEKQMNKMKEMKKEADTKKKNSRRAMLIDTDDDDDDTNKVTAE